MAEQSTTTAARPSGGEPEPVLIDFGKQKRGKVKKLRKGKGGLVDDVHAVIADLREAGTIDGKAQPVIVVVERKSKKAKFKFGL